MTGDIVGQVDAAVGISSGFRSTAACRTGRAPGSAPRTYARA
jgi:hypothetical protein